MLKGLRMFLIILMSVSVAACTQTTSKMTKAERRKVEAQNRAIGQAVVGLAVLGAAVAIGVSSSRSGRYYRNYNGYRGNQHYYRKRGGCVNYGTPNPYSGMCGY